MELADDEEGAIPPPHTAQQLQKNDPPPPYDDANNVPMSPERAALLRRAKEAVHIHDTVQDVGTREDEKEEIVFRGGMTLKVINPYIPSGGATPDGESDGSESEETKEGTASFTFVTVSETVEPYGLTFNVQHPADRINAWRSFSLQDLSQLLAAGLTFSAPLSYSSETASRSPGYTEAETASCSGVGFSPSS